MADVKITKAMTAAAIKAYFGAMENEAEEVAIVDGYAVTVADVYAFAATTLEQINAKAAKAKIKAAEKKAEGDALQAQVEATLTEEFQTAEEITAQVEGEEVTKAKVTARLTKLVAAGIATKEQVKVEGRKGKVMAYRLATADEE